MQLFKFDKIFPDEESCRAHFKALREKNGIVCPKCGCVHHYYEIIRDTSGKYSLEDKNKAMEENTKYLQCFWEDYEKGVTFY